MADRGFLVIADSYTRFLTGSELDHAQGVLQDLFAVILERLTSPLALSNIQGDAFLAYSNDDAISSSGQILDSIEALYFGFRERLTSIIDNTTCPCRACSNVGELDLKFIIHHGEYVVQDMGARRELTGADVIVLHRLLKNDFAEQTGIASYALFTAAAVEALGLEEFKDGTQAYVTELDDFGRIEGIVVDIGERWQSHHATTEIVVGDGEVWFEPVSRVLPHSVEAVWEAWCNPAIRSRWNTLVQGVSRVKGDRMRVGAVDHCAHGKQMLRLRYIDVRPLKHVTLDTALPMNGRLRRTVRFSLDNNGTRMTVKVAKLSGPNAFATFMLRLVGGIAHKKSVHAETVEECRLLEAFLADQRPAGEASEVGVSLAQVEITAAARQLAAG